MLFSRYILSRLTLLDVATRGFGGQIQERSLYEQLLELTDDSADSVQLIKWGLATRFLVASGSSVAGGFMIDRSVLGHWRLKANGESPQMNHRPNPSSVSSVTGQNRKR